MKSKIIPLALALILSACGGSETSSEVQETSDQSANESNKITLTSQAGEVAIVPGLDKLVLVDLSSLDTLKALGAEDKVIGIPDEEKIMPEHLKTLDLSKYDKVGSVKEANFEAINNLKPNLIIIADRVAKTTDRFKEIAPTYHFSIDYSKFNDSFIEQTLNLATIVDKKELAEQKIAEIEAKITELKTKTKGKTALVILVNKNNISAYGTNTRFGLIYDVFGFEQIDPDIKPGTHGMSVSNEYLLTKDPDYLFVVDRNAIMKDSSSNTKVVVENELVKNSKAYKDGNIVYLDSPTWYLTNGGLNSMDMMVEEIEKVVDKK